MAIPTVGKKWELRPQHIFGVRGMLEVPSCQFDIGASARFHGTCSVFPEMRLVFEQKSWEAKSYKCYKVYTSFPHLLPPSKPRSCSGNQISSCPAVLFHAITMNRKELRSLNRATTAMFSARLIQSSWKHSQPGAMPSCQFDIGASARFNGTCTLFPEMFPIFKQKSWEAKSYKVYTSFLPSTIKTT